jgi:hypothetical protein
VLGDAPTAPVAGVDQIAVGGDPRVELGGRQREGDVVERRAPLLVAAEATQRGASRDAARVEPDEVEARPHLRRVEVGPGEDRVVDTRAAGAAGVEEQRADPVSGIGGGQADDRERDRRAVRLGVVERDLERAALELAVALAPADLGGRPLGGAGAESRERGERDSHDRGCTTITPHTGHRQLLSRSAPFPHSSVAMSTVA